MRITEVRIKLADDPDNRLQAFCSITLDDAFVVRDLKIIAGETGPFVAMPSRKLTVNCNRCGCKNYLQATYCNQCGERKEPTQNESRIKFLADIAHPINAICREMIHDTVIRAFEEKKKFPKQP